MKITLLPPLKKIKITQKFGENKVSFYKEMGLLGHNGNDYRARTPKPLYATHSGEIVSAGRFGDGGIGIYLISSKQGDGFKTIYYHLNKVIVMAGDKVVAGQLIGYTGNTGKYTTGPHLHFGLKLTHNGRTLNRDNGYNGAIDPEPYFPNNYSKSRAYHRYGRERSWQAEFWMRFAPLGVTNRWTEAGRHIHRQSKVLKYSIPLQGEMVNALIYGGWDLKAVISPSMTQIWRWYKKDEYNNLIKNL